MDFKSFLHQSKLKSIFPEQLEVTVEVTQGVIGLGSLISLGADVSVVLSHHYGS